MPNRARGRAVEQVALDHARPFELLRLLDVPGLVLALDHSLDHVVRDALAHPGFDSRCPDGELHVILVGHDVLVPVTDGRLGLVVVDFEVLGLAVAEEQVRSGLEDGGLAVCLVDRLAGLPSCVVSHGRPSTSTPQRQQLLPLDLHQLVIPEHLKRHRPQPAPGHGLDESLGLGVEDLSVGNERFPGQAPERAYVAGQVVQPTRGLHLLSRVVEAYYRLGQSIMVSKPNGQHFRRLHRCPAQPTRPSMVPKEAGHLAEANPKVVARAVGDGEHQSTPSLSEDVLNVVVAVVGHECGVCRLSASITSSMKRTAIAAT